MNLSYNSDIKNRNYEKLVANLVQLLGKAQPEVLVQALLLIKKFTENEKSNIEFDMRLMPPLINLAKHEDKAVFENALKDIQVLCENNTSTIL